MQRMMGTAIALILASAAGALVPADQLAKPPADATQFTILSTAGRHGAISEWTAPDGTLMARLHMVLRGQVWDEDEALKVGGDGAIARYELRGSSPQGDVAESFAIANGTASWTSPIDHGSAPYSTAAYYLPQGLSPRGTDLPTEKLVSDPSGEVALLPGGKARIEKLTTLTIGQGAAQQNLTLWALTGLGGTPQPVWTDANGKIFANVGAISVIRAGYEADEPAMQKVQDAAMAKQSPILAHSLATTPAVPVVYRDVQAFVAGTRFDKHVSVVVDHGKIVAIGPVARVKVPANAIVIDGKGKTLVPGLWDCHMHVGDDFTGPSELSIGVTSVRDPGNDDQLTIARRQRRAAGDLLGPHVYASSLIDGKGPNTAQVANVVTSEAEAVKAVDDAKAKGQVGVKFYGTFNPAWVAPAAAEAHKLGLHVHGHLPAGMRPSQAIAAGYDELTHIYFVSMEAMPDDVVQHSNGMQRFSGTGRYMKDVNLDAEPIKSLIATMAKKHIYSDPTLVVVEACSCRRMVICRRLMRLMSARFRPRSNAASARAASRRRQGSPAPIIAPASGRKRNWSGACTRPASRSSRAPTDRGSSWCASSNSMSNPASATWTRYARQRSFPPRSSAPTSIPARSRSAGMPMWFWSMAIRPQRSAICGTRRW